MSILVQFLLRLSFGLALGMAVTSPRHVASGYFRNHLYVTLGLATLAALASYTAAPAAFWYAVGAAVASYVGSVCWLYEAPRAGRMLLWLVAGAAFLAAWAGAEPGWLSAAAIVTSGLVLGLTMAAMLLGHWFLNSPGMELAPLRRLLTFIAVAVAIQAIVCASGVAGHVGQATENSLAWWLFLALRWLFGLVGVAGLVWMAWQTLKIPNTQSATGILYVAVIGAFVGELTGLLLSAESAFPL